MKHVTNNNKKMRAKTIVSSYMKCFKPCFTGGQKGSSGCQCKYRPLSRINIPCRSTAIYSPPPFPTTGTMCGCQLNSAPLSISLSLHIGRADFEGCSSVSVLLFRKYWSSELDPQFEFAVWVAQL